MADFTQIIQKINEDINTNGVGAITGAKLNEVLRDMIAAINAAKQDPLTIDATPTEDSTNPVQSGGVYSALLEKATRFYTPDITDIPPTILNRLKVGDIVSYGNDSTASVTVAVIDEQNDIIILAYNDGMEVGGYQYQNGICTDTALFSLSDMANKVSEAANGHLAGLDSEGNLTDSGIAASDVATASDLAGKQDVISDLATIRSGAAAGATAYQKPSTGIPKTDLASGVQTSLGKADTAVQQVTVGTTTTGNAGTNASVTNSGTSTAPVLDFTIPRGADGADGQDGADAVNPFKGWWPDLAALKAAHTATAGDSAYVKDASPATTWSIYIYDSTASSNNYWADSGTNADTSNVQTFASGEEVNEVHIVNDLTTGGADDVLSAEQGRLVNNDLNSSVYLKIQSSSQDYDSEVEYISNENNLTAYIDSGITADNNTRVIIRTIEITPVCGSIFGSRINHSPANGMFAMNCSADNKMRFDYAKTNQTVDTTLAGAHTYELDGNKCYIDGTLVHTFTASTFSNNLNMHIFGTNGNGTHNNMLQPIKIALVKIYKNGTLVRDYIPVRVGTTGYLYDKVSQTLFGNAGSGSLMYGNDLPVQIVADSVQEVFDRRENRFFPMTTIDAVKDANNRALSDYYLLPKLFSENVWVGLGDSLTYQGSTSPWSPMVEAATGLEFKNCGIGNTCLAGNGDNAFWKRLSAVEAYDPDVVTILGGANDLYQDIPLGTLSELDKTIANKDCTNFIGAYSYIIETLLNWKKTLRIVLMTPPYAHTDGADHTPSIGLTYKDYADATIQVAEYYGLPVVDLYRNMGINKITQDSTLTIGDNMHWNARGSQIAASLLIAKLIEINNAQPIS